MLCDAEAREHREDLVMRDFALEAVEQLFLREAALLEETLHQRVVAFGDFLDQLLAPVSRRRP